MSGYTILGAVAVALALVASAQAQTPQAALARRVALRVLPRATVTVLVDNVAGGGPVLGEWGLAFVIETDRQRLLFDTGEGHVLLGNARALDVDLARTDAIVISHGHLDHTGGLEAALGVTGPVDLYVHPEAFATRYWKEDSGVLKYSMPLSREQLRGRVRTLVETRGPTLVSDAVMVTGQIPRVTDFEDTGITAYAFLDESLKTPDLTLDDQAVVFRVPEGVVIALGCGHAGVVNTMRYVGELLGEKRIYAVIGGTHLIGASPGRIRKTIQALKGYGVQKILLSHCTSVDAFAKVARAFPDRCGWPASGTVVRFGTP
jgi:7,8-dihydropterin-6-yl-methyl-4-(beta-D-ribofuranosyl)aminobenzene 5'-phosphate synthase